MKKEFVPYEEALSLRDLGFNGVCFGRYGTTSKKLFTNRLFKNSEELLEDGKTFTNDLFAAPLYQQAFRWFREEHDLHGLIEVDWDYGKGVEGYLVTICTNDTYSDLDLNVFKTYEEAERLCLKKLIEITKTEKL